MMFPRKWMLGLLVSLLASLSITPAFAQYAFPVPLVLTEREDRSSPVWPWIYIGNEKQTVERESSVLPGQCTGTAPNGAQVKVRCNEPNYILGGVYSCPTHYREKHVGEEVVGTITYGSFATGYSDGYNPDGCEIHNLGDAQVLTRSNQYYIAGPRWQCPSDYFDYDADEDGTIYEDGYNPEACAQQFCPEGSGLAFMPSDINSSRYYQSDGYVCIGVNPEKHDNECSRNAPHVAVLNPIVAGIGSKYQKETDFTVRKSGGVYFVRSYNSLAFDRISNIGLRWTHNYSKRVDEADGNALVYQGNGQVFDFNEVAGVWQGDPDTVGSLLETVDQHGNREGWHYTGTNDDSEFYNAAGQLTNISGAQGVSQILSYNLATSEGGDDNPATLDKVVDSHGNELLFSYDSRKRINRLVDTNGESYLYSYDAKSNLESITYPDDTPTNTDNPKRIYHYEDVDHPHALTGISDENGNRFSTWAYDSKGLAISSEHANGAGAGSLDYTYLNDAVYPRVTVTNELGKQTTYHYTTIHGVRKVTQVEGHQSANCAAANQSYTYDANGFKDLVTDWEGNVTDYDHDARGLEVQRIEAKGTVQERVITTQWHPDFRLPTKITEPDRVIDFTYDAQGLLLERKETPAQ